MLRLGLQLTLRSGREALVRLLITAAAVALGVAMLLGVLAEFHAFEANAYQQCWSCTTGNPVPTALPDRGELWNNSVDFYQGQTINRLDVAALGPNAPLPPGISRLPAPGTYYASPALEALLRTVPADELGDRFPGRLAGTIGQAALNGTDDLVVYVGYTPAALNSIGGTSWVTAIYTGAGQQVFTSFFKVAFYIGVIAVLLPMLVLISTATRLAADRREERFAAVRLVGGTPADIRLIATVEAVISSFAGALLGTVVFLLVRPLLAGSSLLGTSYFESDLTPTIWGYIGMLVIVPIAAAVASLISLRRVQISPLGVSRRATPKKPTLWRLSVLVTGLALYVFGLSRTTHNSIGVQAYPGILITMIGLVIAGPLLTAWSARLFGRVARGSSALLATRRIADNPRVAFRSVTGLVLAVFLGTMVGILVPAINGMEKTPTAGKLSDVLIGQIGLAPAAGQQLIHGLEAIPGASVYPLYNAPGGGGNGSGSGNVTTAYLQQAGGPGQGPGDTVVSCAVMREIAGLGECAPGVSAVQVQDDSIFDDNPLYDTDAIVSAQSPAYHGDLTTLPLQIVLVRAATPAALERVRTYLAVHAPPQTSNGYGSAPTPPRTFGEVVQIRVARADLAENIVDAAVALTLIVAGCSLAVAVGGALVERKRPFTLLRVSGTQLRVLSRVVVLEAAVPLLASTLLAAAIAYGTTLLAFTRLGPVGAGLPHLTSDYFTIMGIGLVVAFGIILLTLPLMRRMTAPASVRFE
jgi:hypothetical protein